MTRRMVLSRVETSPAVTCLGAFRTAEQAVRDTAARRVDVFLLDCEPQPTLVHGLRCLRAARPEAGILVLLDASAGVQVFESLCNGATGCLVATVPSDRLATAIEDAADGGAPLSPELARIVVSLFQRSGHPQSVSTAALSPRERTVLALLACGCTYTAAASRMGISINTVRNHVRHIYEKLDVRSKGQAVATGFRHGLIAGEMVP